MLRRRAVGLVLAGLMGVSWSPPAVPAAAVPAVAWPQFRHDPKHTGVNPAEKTLTKQNVARLQLHWQGIMGQLVSSSPSVVNGVVAIGSSNRFDNTGRLYAFGLGR